MNKNRYGFVVGGLFVVWTAGSWLLSLVPGDELPPAGWLARIPHFDKIVHCGFYLIETGLLVLWLRPSPRGKFWIVAGVVAFSGVIELVQSVCGRSDGRRSGGHLVREADRPRYAGFPQVMPYLR